MKVGTLELIEDNGHLVGEGEIRTLKFSCEFTLELVTDRKSAEAPTHAIWARVNGGQRVPLGLAWSKLIGKGELKGETFLQLTFDDPSFDAAFYVSAFPRSKRPAKGKVWPMEIVWNRPRGVAASAPGAQPAGAIDDEIPF